MTKKQCASAQRRPALCFELAEGRSAALVVAGTSEAHQHHARPAVHPATHLHHGAAAAPLLPAAREGGGAARPRRGGAARLKRQLHSLAAPSTLAAAVLEGSDECPPPEQQLPGGCGPPALRLHLDRARTHVGGLLRPQGCSPGDDHWLERTINVVTSFPFMAIGVRWHGRRDTPAGRRHASSMVAVGAVAALYHGSKGRMRRLTRKLDYWTIALSSSLMVKALFADRRWARHAASASMLAIPFAPFHVSMGHTLVMQAEFARQATQHKAVRRDLRQHYATALLGIAAFAAEDPMTELGYGGAAHAMWHCLAAWGVATMGGLIAHKERLRLQRGGGGGGAGLAPLHCSPGGGGGKPLGTRGGVHCSAASLRSLQGGSPRGVGYLDSPLSSSSRSGYTLGSSP